MILVSVKRYNPLGKGGTVKSITQFILTLILLLSASTSFAQQSKLETYGYFDLEAEVGNQDAESKIWTFHQHHLNVITIYHLDDRFRVFAEMAWEHEATFEAEGEDHAKIDLTRAWLEYKHSDAFKVQVGKILVSFGIYGEKYNATPTFLSTFLPSSIYGQHKNSVGGKDLMYPKHLTGIQALGSFYAKDWGIDYYLYVTNGRGPTPYEKDNNVNKGLGGRVIVNPPLRPLRLGVSYYSDKDGNSFNTKQSTLGFDVALDYSNVLVETEVLLPRGEKVDTNNTPNGKFQNKMGYYVQGAYTFFEQLTPFVRYDFWDTDVDKGNDGENILTVGINYSFTPRVYLKNEIHFHGFQDAVTKSYEMYVASLAVAF